jgi:hypothetical protein
VVGLKILSTIAAIPDALRTDAEPASPKPAATVDRASLALIWLASAATLAATIYRVCRLLPRAAGLDHVSGVWIASAQDLADGVFYRPLIGPLGYGGTRYFPLHIVIQAALIKLGLSPLAAGHAIAIASIAGVIAAVAIILRRAGIPRDVAVPVAFAVLGAASIQLGVTAIRGDLLPTALSFGGLATIYPRPGEAPASRRRVLTAGLLFALAFTAKQTCVAALVATIIVLVIGRQRRHAITLAAVAGAGMAIALVLLYLCSDGRALADLRACSTAGATLVDIAHAPLKFVRLADVKDTLCLAFTAVTLASVLAAPRVFRRELAVIVLALTLLVTVGLFASPGVSYNHLVELQTIAVVTFVLAGAARPRRLGLVAGIAAMLGVIGAYHALDAERTQVVDKHADAEAVRAAIGPTNGRPILSEDALLPVLLGEPVVMLDPFMFRVISANEPALADDLWRRMDAREFAAIALTTGDVHRIEDASFGRGFVARLTADYHPIGDIAGYFLYLPTR